LIVKLLLGLAAVALASAAGAILTNRPPLLAPPGPLERIRIFLTQNIAETGAAPRLPELAARHYEADPDTLFDAVLRAAADAGWEVAAVDRDDRALMAVVTTPVLRFRDDMRIQAVPEPRGSSLRVRSASRTGRGDFGANLRHVLDLYEYLDQALVQSAPVE